MVDRLDLLGKLSKVSRTPQGGVSAPAYLTRTGVFQYQMKDGSVLRELRHPSDVFAADSLETLRGAPVTVGHPAMVDARNWKRVTVGHVGDSVTQEGKFVAADLRVQDGDAVARVEDKTLVEISCGYTCDSIKESGVFDGETYDARQTNIRYNHVGLGPSGWGRAGNDVRLRMDSSDSAYTVFMDVDPKDPKARTDASNTPAPPAAPSPVVVHLDTAELERLRGENAALKADLATARADASDAVINKRVTERLDLLEKARKVLGPETKFDGMGEREVLTAVVAKSYPSQRTDSKTSDDFLRGLFSAAVDKAESAPAAQAREDANNAVPAGETEQPWEKARREDRARNANAWKTKE